ncbi:uncharacterized protein LOC127866614 [Dreissena polymorpha]|uniref:Uncharacterized protein n=1 Tax=Dreissena polymorpha TaxID=45954 RepID=A0A9D4S0U2_DREPO|nr:uncharacterized protein LOC127866614 [Dreissena polymorpha]KAH3886198.1 hypothetical protein DPMN_010199 [Dreissena polymorpha]
MVGEGDLVVQNKVVAGDVMGVFQVDSTNCTYSRMRSTRSKGQDNVYMETTIEECEHKHLVDQFVQEVIEKAKAEYQRQNSSRNDASNATCKSSLKKRGKRNGKKSNASCKGLADSESAKGRRKPNYKYSEPVDANAISEYEDGDSLLQRNPHCGNERQDVSPQSASRFSAVRTSLRRLLTCCFGKT